MNQPIASRYFVYFMPVAALTLAACCSTDPPSVVPDDARNVILIIADDMGAEQVPSYASELDKGGWFNPADLRSIRMLEEAGVRFKDAWSNPTCTPTRAGVLTGNYSCVHELYSPTDISATRFLEDRTVLYTSLPLMVPTPYKTAHFGKWHVGDSPTNPNDTGWDYYAGGIGGTLRSYVDWDKSVNGSDPPTPTTDHATHDVVDEFSDWIDLREKDGAPFVAVLAFNAAHSTEDPADWVASDVSTDCGSFWLPSSPPIRQIYKAQLHCMDYKIGEVIATLKSDHKEILKNTVIIFIGDNGTPEAVGEGPVGAGFAKASLYQGGVHVPMIIADGYWLLDAEDRKPTWPLKPHINSPNRTSDALVHTRDLYGTILDLSGNPDWDCGNISHSLVPFLEDPAETGNEYVVTEKSANAYAIRNAQYKLIRESGRDTFYDLIATPWEKTPLSLGSLSVAEQAAYDALTAELAEYEDFIP